MIRGSLRFVLLYTTLSTCTVQTLCHFSAEDLVSLASLRNTFDTVICLFPGSISKDDFIFKTHDFPFGESSIHVSDVEINAIIVCWCSVNAITVELACIIVLSLILLTNILIEKKREEP